jgi:glycosyltransferase involved in cell wall biosynthesis
VARSAEPRITGSLTLILPVRDWPGERIDLCIDSFLGLQSRTLTEILVVDFGSAEPVRLRSGIPPLVRLLRLEAEVWSLAEAINAGVLSAKNDLLAKTDADILIGPKSRAAFDQAVESLCAGGVGLALTQAVDLHQSISPQAAAAAIRRGRAPLGRLRAKWGQGGLVFFPRATWDVVGGFDSRFTGWGNEDNDFAERVRRCGLRLEWTDSDALKIFHLWHPPSYAATGVLGQRLKNQKIAKEDKSVLRSLQFRHSNFATVAAPAVWRAVAPLVTLGIATTARPHRDRMITEAINSFRDQIDNDFEILVIDNGSTEEQTATLKRKLARLRWTDRLRIETIKKGSIPASRNMISAIASGRYVCVVDDDDIALSCRLADHLRPFELDGLAHGSHGGWIDFDESTGVIERNTGKQRTIATLLKGTGKITAHPASLYRTDILRAVPYDETFALGSDFDLAVRLANLGFDIRHTNTYVTLRRYHSTNVTITGQSNQVSNGAAARSRALASFAWQKLPGLEEAARKSNADIYCRNQMSIDSLAELIPGYSGTWQIYVPVAAIAPSEENAPLESAAALLRLVAGGQEEYQAPANDLVSSADLEPSVSATPSPLPQGGLDASILEALLNIVPGDICAKRSGLNQPIYFRSEAIAGLKKAKRLRAAIEQLLNIPIQINSVRQGQLDREAPFNWSASPTKTGERVLMSERFSDLSDLLLAYGRIESGSLLQKAVSIMSDNDDLGEAYHLLTPSIRGYDQLRALRFDLERRTQLHFQQVAAGGVPSELTLSARSH